MTQSVVLGGSDEKERGSVKGIHATSFLFFSFLKERERESLLLAFFQVWGSLVKGARERKKERSCTRRVNEAYLCCVYW